MSPLDRPELPKTVPGAVTQDEKNSITSLISTISKDDESFVSPNLFSLGDMFLDRGRFSAAEELYVQAMRAAEPSPAQYLEHFTPPLWLTPHRTSPRIIFSLQGLYPELVKILVAQNKDELALNYAAKGRSRLLDAIIQRRVLGGNSLSQFADPNLGKIREMAKSMNSVFIVYWTVFRSDPAESHVKELWAWVVQSNGEVHRKTLPLHLLPASLSGGGLGNLSDYVLSFQETLPRGIVDRMTQSASNRSSSPSTEKAVEHLKLLHKVLIEPLQEYLPRDPEQKLIIVPDGDLFMVPFAALMDDSGNHLIDNHVVSIAPTVGSLALLYDLQKKGPKSAIGAASSALVVGDPVMPLIPPGAVVYGTLPPLEGARREAKLVADLLGTKPLIGAEAKEDVVFKRMTQARTIHFATHGLLGDESLWTIGLQSSSAVEDLPPGALTLTPNPSAKRFATKIGLSLPVNGFLSGGKILLATLDADLVTMSACDTARGRTDEHQFSGLPLAFLAAGARTVVMTYWAIPDAPTAELMPLFYKELKAGRSKASALRFAMLETKKRHPGVENWGAFVLIGLPQ